MIALCPTVSFQIGQLQSLHYRKVEAAVKARESSDGTHRLTRVTTDLELGTIPSASYSQGQQESAPFGSLISVLDEGVIVQSAAFAALPAALRREESEKPKPGYKIVEPECFVLNATPAPGDGVQASSAPDSVSTLVVPAKNQTCVRLDRPPSREDAYRDLCRLLAEEEQFKQSREEIRKNYGDHVANCMTSPVETELARTNWLYEQYRTGDHPCIRADCMCSRSLYGTYNTDLPAKRVIPAKLTWSVGSLMMTSWITILCLGHWTPPN